MKKPTNKQLIKLLRPEVPSHVTDEQLTQLLDFTRGWSKSAPDYFSEDESEDFEYCIMDDVDYAESLRELMTEIGIPEDDHHTIESALMDEVDLSSLMQG